MSFPSESLIPQLDGSDPSPKFKPIFHGSNKSTTESNLAPSSSSYSMFGYCTFDKCNLCPKRTRAKVGDFYACFVSKGSSTKGCDLVHAHSRTPYMRLMTFTDQFCQIRSNLVKFNPKIVGKGHFVDFF